MAAGRSGVRNTHYSTTPLLHYSIRPDLPPMENARRIGARSAAGRTSTGGAGPYVPFLLTYLGVWILFLLLMVALNQPWPRAIGGIDLLLLSLATFRLTELVSEEKVARALRAPFCECI